MLYTDLLDFKAENKTLSKYCHVRIKNTDVGRFLDHEAVRNKAALCGILQLTHVYPNQEVPSKHLRARLAMGRLAFDWGTSWCIIQEAVASLEQNLLLLEKIVVSI